MTLPGIDVSFYQTTTPTLDGLSFCIAKASEGLSADPMYATHVRNTKAAGIVSGAYHFNRADIAATPTQQAKFFLATAGDVDLYALDVEGSGKRFSVAQCREFISVIHAAGKRIGLYASLSGFPSAGQDWDWVAFYDANPPPIPWDFWQFGPRVIDGHSIDGDTFHGDAAALAALVGGDMHYVKAADSIGTFTFAASAKALIDTTDTSKRYQNVVGTPYQVAAAVNLVDATGAPIDVDGHKPPLNGRDQLYLVANGAGPAVFVIRSNGKFTASGITQADKDAAVLAGRRAQYDADLAAANAAPITLGPRP